MSDTVARPLTAKGQRTRDRIIDAAAALMVEHGIAAVSLDLVGKTTATSKSQMYHYFSSKNELVGAVVEHVSSQILSFQRGLLEDMTTIEDLEHWADVIVDFQRQGDSFAGCPLGTLASELSGDPNQPRAEIELAFGEWGALLEQGFVNMKEHGEFREDANPRSLALSTLAALQGGLLMSKATQDVESLRIPLDSAIAYVRGCLIS